MSALASILNYHGRMLADSERVERFARALAAVIRPGDVVADVGCGTGILSALACSAGARRVYAIEVGPIGRLADRLVAHNRLADRITVLRGLSTDLELPEKVDVIVSETVGNAAFNEGILAYLADARARFLAPGGRVVPRALSLVAAPVRDVALHESLVAAWRRPVAGYDVSPLLSIAAQQLHLLVLKPDQLAGEPRRAATIDLARVEHAFVTGDVALEVATDGPVVGFALCFETELADGVFLSNAPSSRAQHWSHGFLPLLEPLPARRGDPVQLEIATYDGETWRWRGRVAGRSFDLNTLAGKAFDFEGLQGEERRGQLGDRGRAAQEALALFDGRRTVAEIARALRDGRDDRFPTEAAARRFVNRLARQFGP